MNKNSENSNQDLSFSSSNSQELDLTNPDIMESIQKSQSIELDVAQTQQAMTAPTPQPKPKTTKKPKEIKPVNNPYLNPTSAPAPNDPIAQSMENAETTNEFDLLALNPSARTKLRAATGTPTPEKKAPKVKKIKNPYKNPAPQAPENDPIAQTMSQAETTNEFDLLALNPSARTKLRGDTPQPSQKAPKKQKVKSHEPKEKSEIHVNKTLITVISVSAVVLIAAVALPFISYNRSMNASLEAEKEVIEVEKKLETAVQQGSSTEDIDKLYASLVAKQKTLDSISSKSGNKKENKVYDDTIAMFMDEIMQELHAENYRLPKTLLDRVTFYVNKFTSQKTKGGMKLIMSRRETYFPYIEQVFKDNKVPLVLAYVSMQESLLNPNAKSHAGAAGLWQFIPSTGRAYGLKINSSVDERLQWRKATVAAAGYFRKLLSLYGKGEGVLLAIASYNAGEHKIMKALSLVEDPLLDRDFFYLYRTSTLLAKETREYVPQILARAIIDRNRDYYGF